MSRPPAFPADEKIRIVLSILAGETDDGHEILMCLDRDDDRAGRTAGEGVGDLGRQVEAAVPGGWPARCVGAHVIERGCCSRN